MDRVAPAAASRDHHNPDQGPSAPNASYRHDAGGYQRQPRPYGPSPPNHGSGSSSSGSSSGRYAEYVNTADYRPAGFDADAYHSNKKPRLDHAGQHWPQYEASHPSHRQQPPGPPPAGYAHSSRPADSTSLPRFPVPVMHPASASSAYSSQAPAPQAPYQASRAEMPNSAFPSPPLISPLNGSPYSRRESTLSGGGPAVPSPNSSHSSGRDDARPSQYSEHRQGQGAQYGSTAPPPPHGATRPGPLPTYGGAPSTGPAPPQPLPPMRGPPDDRAHDSHYPFHGVPYSGGPRQFKFTQPYSAMWQEWAPTLPPDFEDREAYCDSSGAIRRKQPARDRPRHEHQHPQQQQQQQQHGQQHQPHRDYQRQDPAAHYQQYEHNRERSYMQQLEQQQQQSQEDMFRQQQSMPQDPRHDPRHDPHYHDEQRRQQPYEPREQHNLGHHHDRPDHNHQYREHPEHRDYRGHNEHNEHHGQHDPQYHSQYPQPHDRHQQPNGLTHYEPQGQGFENIHMEDGDVIPGWEPEIKPIDITPENENNSADDAAEGGAKQELATTSESSASKSTQSSPPSSTNRAAPLHEILHPVDTTPLMPAAEIPARPENEADSVQIPPAPSAVPAPMVEEAPDESAANNANPETESPPKKAQRRRRGVFTQKQRDETSQTRTYGACLRCKSQRVRCVPSPLGPYDMCVTCEQVSRNSKKVLHTIRCVRWRLSSMTTYRSGGLELTKRWEGTEVHNINDWVNEDVKEIDVKLYYSSHMHRYDLCDTPVKFRIREFAPLPDDVCLRKWSKRVEDENGTPKIEKKVVPIPAFALADVDEAEKTLDSYFKMNTINAMYDATRHCVPIVREHYLAAIRHYQSLPDGDFEKTFLEKFFRLWFYTRFTTGSSYISGGEKLGCKPVSDPDYPMGERISVPRMITAQCDSIMVTKFLKPLSRDLTLELEKIFRTGNPYSWFTLYICTFMLLGEVSFSSQDRRRHGTDNWITETPYSLYEFVTDLQFGGNILLCYWHYYRTMDPMDAGWDIFCQIIEPPLSARAKLESAKGKGKKKVHVTRDQRRMVMSHWPKMVELANILCTVHHNKSFEHPLYFVSQMYMREWEIREVYSYTPPGCVKNTQLNITLRK